MTLVAISNKYKTKRKKIKTNKATAGIKKTSYDNLRIILKGGGAFLQTTQIKSFELRHSIAQK